MSILCLSALLIIVAFYAGDVVVVGRPKAIQILVAVVIFVWIPLASVIGLLRWWNARIEFRGTTLVETDFLGRVSPPEKVLSVRMTPPLRDAGVVGFELGNGWVHTDTRWINIKRHYRQLGELGVAVEPWRDKATSWKDVWGG